MSKPRRPPDFWKQRVSTFSWDNPRDVQVRLHPFDIDRLVEVSGRRVRSLYPTESPERLAERVDDEVLSGLARAVAGKLGGKVGVAPRIFLRKLVAGLLDRVDLYPDFEPRRDFELALTSDELTVEERAAAGGSSPDDFDLDI